MRSLRTTASFLQNIASPPTLYFHLRKRNPLEIKYYTFDAAYFILAQTVCSMDLRFATVGS